MTAFLEQLYLVAADPRLPAALACALLAGTVRGFSGFGSALVFIPIMSALFSPRVAAGTFAMIDLAVASSLVASFVRVARWREVLPMAAGGVVGIQFGAVILKYANPLHLRWASSTVILAVIGVLASGWRYRGRPIPVISTGVGLVSGLLGGAVQIAGPPVIVYWLGSTHEISTVRANFLAYFTLLSLGMSVAFYATGVLSLEAAAIALLTGPAQVFSTWVGARIFKLASANLYRVVAYGIIAIVAVLSLPILDGFWHR